MNNERSVRVAIIEDDPDENKRLCDIIELYGKNHDIHFYRNCFDTAEKFLGAFESDYDVVFMDIQLPDIDGMTAAHRLREKDKNVTLVFVTNFAQYAINGYEVSATDFIVKPVEYDWFEPKMDNVLSKLKNVSDVVLVVKTPDSVVTIKSSQLKYVEVQGHWLVFHTENGNVTAYGSLNKIEPKLVPAKFVRCNSCYLVNPAFVQSISYDIAVVGGDSLKISYSKRKEFKQAMALYLGGSL